MDNVRIADAKVIKLRTVLKDSFGKRAIAVSMDDAVGYLQSLERLAAVERHLYNLTSNGYIQ